jgi:hypothetical protein
MKLVARILVACTALGSAFFVAQDESGFHRPDAREPLFRLNLASEIKTAGKPQPFLGVVTRTAPLELTAQLKQPEGFGLVVDDVLEGSPARAADLRPNDLLRMFDDQWLVNPPQLEALVRRAGKGKEVLLTILREGAEQKVHVKIGEKVFPVRRPLPPGAFQEHYRNHLIPRDEAGEPPREGARPLDRQTRYATDRARVIRRDDSGVYELERAGGRRILTAKRHDGSVIWTGPVDTEEERKGMPEEVRRKFDEIESSRPLERLDHHPAHRLPPPQPPGDPAPSPRGN